jgi:hypothetical protein
LESLKLMTRIVLITCLLLTSTLPAFSQARDTAVVVTEDDSLIQMSRDTVLIKSYADRYSPRKALLLAAIAPGAGQIYTKKYWKLPLVYGGLGYVGYWAGRYQQGYKKYKLQLFDNIEQNLGENGKNLESGLTTSYLRTIVDRYRRERDFMIILMGAVYLLQMVDAHVDAHLKEFDLNPQLQVSIEPTMSQDAMMGRQTGVSLIIRF